jgi:hypothetical protein
MIADLVEGLEHASIISLDHDLNRLADDADPGTGYDVAKLLEELIPCCPIVIHPSNVRGGLGRALLHICEICAIFVPLPRNKDCADFADSMLGQTARPGRAGSTIAFIHSTTTGSRRLGRRSFDGGSAGRSNRPFMRANRTRDPVAGLLGIRRLAGGLARRCA